MSGTRTSLQDYLRDGYVQCPHCGGLNHPRRAEQGMACFQCNLSLTTPPPPPTPAVSALVRPTARKAAGPAGAHTSGSAKKKAPPPNPQANRGKIGSLAGKRLILSILGDPISQGSGDAIKAGVYKHSDGEHLYPWRNSIQDAARSVCGEDWVAVNAAVDVTLVLTVKTLATTRRPTACDSYRDLDKLQRAIGDALSPSKGWKMLASDARIRHWDAVKTYPRPFHTHPAALDEPGAWLSVAPACPGPSWWPSDEEAMPGCRLVELEERAPWMPS